MALSLTREMPRLLTCLGFGIDHFHGVCHHSFLENTARRIREGGFLGCLSLLAGTPEGDAFLAVAHHLARSQPEAPSIVVSSIAATLRGEFGDYHPARRTEGSTLFINPLMSLYRCCDVPEVAAMMRFARPLAETESFAQVRAILARERARRPRRDWLPLPV